MAAHELEQGGSLHAHPPDLFDRVWPLGKHPRVITLRPDELRERTPRIFPRGDELNNTRKVVFRPPAKLAPRAFVDVHAVNAREHRPTARGVHLLVTGNMAADNRRRIGPQFPESWR